MSSLQISSTVYSASRNDFLDSLTHDVNKEEHEKEHEEEHEEERQEENEEEDQENKVQQEVFNKAEHDELEKLNKSSCINLLNETFQKYASQSLTEEHFSNIKSKCADLRSQFSDCLSSIINETINELFDELKQF